MICPSWESYAPAPGETVLTMDPGMAFGTGTHETTRLCIQLLEEAVTPGMDPVSYTHLRHASVITMPDHTARLRSRSAKAATTKKIIIASV